MSTQAGTGLIPEWTVADRLRKAREATGMDAREFAEHVGISRNTVSNYENGKTTRINRPMLAAWSMATGVPIQWLETGTAPTQPEPDGGGSVECTRRDSNSQPSDPKVRVLARVA